MADTSAKTLFGNPLKDICQSGQACFLGDFEGPGEARNFDDLRKIGNHQNFNCIHIDLRSPLLRGCSRQRLMRVSIQMVQIQVNQVFLTSIKWMFYSSTWAPKSPKKQAGPLWHMSFSRFPKNDFALVSAF